MCLYLSVFLSDLYYYYRGRVGSIASKSTKESKKLLSVYLLEEKRYRERGLSP